MTSKMVWAGFAERRVGSIRVGWWRAVTGVRYSNSSSDTDQRGLIHQIRADVLGKMGKFDDKCRVNIFLLDRR